MRGWPVDQCHTQGQSTRSLGSEPASIFCYLSPCCYGCCCYLAAWHEHMSAAATVFAIVSRDGWMPPAVSHGLSE